MQGRTVTTRYGVTRKRRAKRLKYTAKLFRNSLQIKKCLVTPDLNPFGS